MGIPWSVLLRQATVAACREHQPAGELGDFGAIGPAGMTIAYARASWTRGQATAYRTTAVAARISSWISAQRLFNAVTIRALSRWVSQLFYGSGGIVAAPAKAW
jgi:hypothetical protein